MRPPLLIPATVLLALSACAIPTVRQVDLDAWVGRPVADLETHPIFVTLPLVKTTASDGTEVWNYVNGMNIGQCDSGGQVFSGKKLSSATYNEVTSCIRRFAACNNIFHVRNGVVLRYTPIGTGGARCYTEAKLQPGFKGAADIR